MSKEIKAKIDELNHRIEELLDPSCFVLIPEIEELNNQIFTLQTKCTHNYINGVCEFCYKEEK